MLESPRYPLWIPWAFLRSVHVLLRKLTKCYALSSSLKTGQTVLVVVVCVGHLHVFERKDVCKERSLMGWYMNVGFFRISSCPWFFLNTTVCNSGGVATESPICSHNELKKYSKKYRRPLRCANLCVSSSNRGLIRQAHNMDVYIIGNGRCFLHSAEWDQSSSQAENAMRRPNPRFRQNSRFRDEKTRTV